MVKGKLIVLYGINNIGKSTQASLLAEKIKLQGKKAKLIKYPIYDLESSGPMLNDFLRKGNPDVLTAREAQLVYAYNRAQFEPEIDKMLAEEINVVAEDYWGTGVAWGMGYGVDKDFLLRINQPFQREDMAIFLKGNRFTGAVERDHRHEEDGELVQKVALAHEELAREFSWIEINANQTIEDIQKQIWQQVIKIL